MNTVDFFNYCYFYYYYFFSLVESTAVLGGGRGGCECMCVVGARASEQQWVTLGSGCMDQAG